jgi:hypothetical protein
MINNKSKIRPLRGLLTVEISPHEKMTFSFCLSAVAFENEYNGMYGLQLGGK